MQIAKGAVNTAFKNLIREGHLVPIVLTIGLLLTVVMLSAVGSHKASAAANSTINFQARVLRSSGSVIPDGNISVQFKLYDASSGGSNSWTETQTLPAKNGYITASLGSVTSFPGTIDWSQELWLTMNVAGDGEMGPNRMKITAVPYAFRSGQADSLTNGAGTIGASGLAQLSPGSVQNINSTDTLLQINQQGVGDLLQLQSSGSDKFTVSNSGNVFVVGGLTVSSIASTGNLTIDSSFLDVSSSGRFTGTATSVLTGSIDPEVSTTVTGDGTKFLSELVVGDRILVSGETRTVVGIDSDTSLTIGTPFSNNGPDSSPDRLPAELIVRDSGNNVDLVVNDLGNVGIGTTSPGQTLTVNGTLGIQSGFYETIFQAGAQSGDITYTLPTASVNGVLSNASGILSWTTDQTLPTHAGIDDYITITSNGDGTANVSGNTASFLNDAKTTISRATIAANTSLALTDNVINYVVADRDTSAWAVLSNPETMDYVRYLPYAEIYRSGNNLHIQVSPIYGYTQESQVFERFRETERYAREGGLDAIGVDSGLNITVNGGKIWSTFTEFNIPPVTSSTTWFDCHHDSSAWHCAYNANTPVINNTQYDPGTNPATLSDTYWTVNYIYRGIEGQDHMYRVLGNSQYATLEAAKASNTIGSIPDLITSHAMLIGRIIVQKNTTSNYTIESSFNTIFEGASAITLHAGLTGLTNDDHTQYALLAGRSGGQTLIGGGGVTDKLRLQGTSGLGTSTAPAIEVLVGSGGATTALTILNNGNVGIGDASPAALFTVGNGDLFQVDGSGNVSASGGMTIGNSSTTVAGTLRWTGTDFEGYDGSDWIQLNGGSAGVLSGTNVTFTSGLANVGASVTGAAVETLLFTSATAVSNIAGVTGYTAPADGSFRTCLIKNNAAITAGTLTLRWRVNGVSVGSAACNMDATTNRQSSSVINSGVVNFTAGDTIGIAFDTVGMAPTTNDFTVYWSVEYTSGAAGGTTLQEAYDNSSAPALLTTADAKDLQVILENTATDSNFLINITTGSTGKFAVQNGGTDILKVDSSGVEADTLAVTNGLTVSSGDLTISSGALVVQSAGASITGGIDNNSDGITNAGDITGIGTNLTASGALTISSTGANDLILTSGSGIIALGSATISRTAAGDTTIDLVDGLDTTFIIANSGAGLANLSVEGSVTADSFDGDGSSLINLDAANITSGILDDSRLSSNVGLLDLTQTYSARQIFSAGLTLGNTANATAGNIRWTGTDFEGYNGSDWVSFTTGGGGGPGGAAGNILSIIKTADETVNNSNTLQNDNHLKFDIEASGNLTFRFIVQAVSGTTPDIKFAVTAPSGATCDVNVIDAISSVSLANIGCGVSTGLIASTGTAQTYEITGTIRNGSTAGTVYLQWAQNTADASNSTILEGSYVNVIPESNGSTTPSNAFVQNGNSFGAAAIIGTTDSNELRLITGGTTALTIDTSQGATFAGLLSATAGASIIGGLDNNSDGITNAGDITGVGTNLTANGALTITSTGSNDLSLDSGNDLNLSSTNNLILTSGSGSIIIDASTLKRTAAGLTTIDLVDGSDTMLAITNSGAGSANLTTDGAVGIGSTIGSNKLAINQAATADTVAQAIIYTGGINNKGLVIQGYSGQDANAFEVQNNTGQALVSFDKTGQLVLGNDAVSAQAGLISFNDSTGANGFTAVLGTDTLTASWSINLPDEGGTICVQSSANCGFIVLAPSGAQTDSSTKSSIFINKTGATGNMITLQDNGTTSFSVLNSGALALQLTDASAFNIKNVGGTNYFNVDTSAGIIQIGGASADATGVILVLDNKNTDGDPTGQDGAMYYNSKRGSFRCYQNARGWTDCLGTPKPNTRRPASISYAGNGTAFTPVGDLATIVSSTSTATAATNTEPTKILIATSNASGNYANLTSANTNYNTNASPSYQAHVSINAITTVRVWFGLTNQLATTMQAGANPAGIYAAFRFDTGAGDATWKCITKDGANQNVQNSGIAPAAGVGQKFEIIISSGVVEFRINGAQVCNNVANLPPANTLLRHFSTVGNLAVGARSIGIAWVYIDSDY